jgi:hypothetical protein
MRGGKGRLLSTTLNGFVIALWLLVVTALDPDVQPGSLVLGIVGWLAALVLRIPVALVARKGKSLRRAQQIVVGSSGPAEELVRLAVILVTAQTFGGGLYLGLGWASAEIVYTTAAVWAASSARRRLPASDPRAACQSPAAGMYVTASVERLGIAAFHIGAALALAKYPTLVIPVMALHSGLNVVALRLAHRGTVLTEAFIVTTGVLLFVSGLGLWGRL